VNAFANTIGLPDDTRIGMPATTITDAQRILASWTDLAPGRAQKLRTALATAARVLAPDGHPTAAAAVVPFDCVSLRRLLQAPAATFGMSPGRRTSLCSELRYVLRRLDRHDPDDRGRPLSGPLGACLEALPDFRRLAIVDFLRFLDFAYRYRPRALLQLHQPAQRAQPLILLIDQARIFLKCRVAPLANRMLKFADGQRIQQVVFAVNAVLVIASS